MGKERRVEVQPDAQPRGPVHPSGEMLRGDLVPLDLSAAGFQVDGVQAEAVFAGDETERLRGVGAEFVGRCARPG